MPLFQFLLFTWLKRSSNQLKYTTEMIRGETQTDGGSITCLMTFLFGTQLLVTHLVMAFFVGDNHDILGICLAGPKQQNRHSFSLCLVWYHSHTPHIFHVYRDDNRPIKCHDQLSDQELVAKQNVTKHEMVATTVWVSSRNITVELVTLTLLCFSRNLSWLCQWHFAKLITVKKKSRDIVTEQAMVAKMSRNML